MKNLKINVGIIIVSIIIIFGVIEISRQSFLNYEKTIVSQQTKQLLTISKLIGKSFEFFLEEKIKMINNLSSNILIDLSKNNSTFNIRKRIDIFNELQKDSIINLSFINTNNLEKMYFYSFEEKKISFKNKEDFINRLGFFKEQNSVYISDIYKNKENLYMFDIFKLIYFEGKLKGFIFVQINIANIYKYLVEPIKAGEFGYAMVKNSDGAIIMHPVNEQIGYDVLEDRKNKYPDFYYDDLEILIKKQLSLREGTHTYYSYWWTQEKLLKVKKIQGFSSVDITNKFWIIAVTMSYDEIREPIKKYLYNIIFIDSILIFILSIALFFIMKIINIKESYKVKMSYLKELNESSEILRKREREIYQKHKLEVVGSLTGEIAHEFNNILTPIMGYSEMILNQIQKTDEIYEDIEIINNSSKKARDLIEQILMFSGNKNNKIQYEIINITKVIIDSIKFFEATKPSNIKIIKKFDENNIYKVFANETLIHQSILNLCINACDAMKNKSDILEISVGSTDNYNDNLVKATDKKIRKYVKITIKDTGCGIDDEVITKIFDPFFTQKENTNKLGLGLTIVMGIISKHGGKIFVDSTIGIGSQFDIYLPQSEDTILKDKSENLSDIKNNLKILIIGKQFNLVEKISFELGYKPTIYDNANEIIKDFKNIKDKFDVVISDISFPEISGIQLAKKFKEKNKRIKVILLMDKTDEPLEEYIQKKLIDAYLLEPFSEKTLKNLLIKL